MWKGTQIKTMEALTYIGIGVAILLLLSLVLTCCGGSDRPQSPDPGPPPKVYPFIVREMNQRAVSYNMPAVFVITDKSTNIEYIVVIGNGMAITPRLESKP